MGWRGRVGEPAEPQPLHSWRAVCCGFVREPGAVLLCSGLLEPAGAVRISVCQRGCGDGCAGVRETVRMYVMRACV